MRPKPTWLAVAWTLIVFAVCWTPRAAMPVSEEIPRTILLIPVDKLVHWAVFVPFGFAWAAAAPGRAGWVAVASVAAAAISELGQATPLVNRDAERADGVADVVGAVAGVAAYAGARAALRSRSRGRAHAPAAATAPSAGTP